MGFLSKFFNSLFGIKKGSLDLLFKYDLGAESLASPVCEDIDGDGLVETILCSAKGEVFVFSSDFSLKWKYLVSENISEQESLFLDGEKSNSINHHPLVKDLLGTGCSQIFFGTEYGSVYALDHLGKVLWKYDTGHPIRGGINFFESRGRQGLIFASFDGYVHVLSSKGVLLRKFLNDVEIESTPVVVGNSIIVGDNLGRVKSLSFKGSLNWVFSAKGKITSKPVLGKLYDGLDVVFVSCVDNNLYCLGLDGSLLWVFKSKGSIYSEPVILDINGDGFDEIVFGSADGVIYVLNLNGSQLWCYETDFWVVGRPVLRDVDRDGVVEVIVGSYDNNIYVLNGKGLYVIEYVPGVSGIIAQNSSFSDIPSNNPGDIIGDKLWEFGTGGLVVGCAVIKDVVVVQTKSGKVLWLSYKEGK